MPATNADTYVNVNYNNGSPAINQQNAISLDYGDSVILQLAGFPQGCSIDTVTFYQNQVVNGVDQKNTNASVGNWTRSGGNSSNLTVYSCTGQSNGNVQVEDTENQDNDDKYWYAIHISGNGSAGPWDLDPELINKGKGGG